MHTLNDAFARFANSIGVAIPNPIWRGSVDSLAGRQLKWVYPAAADDDEFLKRATLASTLVVDSLDPASLRKLLNAVGKDLHMNDESPPRPLGSRNLLQRVTLIALLIETIQPSIVAIPMLVKQAEGKVTNGSADDLQAELARSHQLVRHELAPLAFLYDLRTHGGFAHTPNRAAAATAAAQLGLTDKNWHRIDYLRLLSLIAESVMQVSNHLGTAAQELERRRCPKPG
jgi:hypothetical protein